MGTRGLIHVYDNENEKILVTIYRQFDCYPDGLGAELKGWLKDSKIVNGYGSNARAPYAFNGMGDLAAWLVWKLKKGEIGNVYIHPLGEEDCWEEYIYELRGSSEGQIRLTLYDTYGGKPKRKRWKFEGFIKDFDPDVKEEE